MNDGEENSWGVDVLKVDQGGSRGGMGEIERKNYTGRRRPRAVDMLKDRFATRGLA